ncbi:MAG TPA: DUF4038 domain-containing protein, partial [Pyrinomonadaceae bacterium]|nr:DUF4038 domain-containing protein [Pyrinomonadaceae bacterium]
MIKWLLAPTAILSLPVLVILSPHGRVTTDTRDSLTPERLAAQPASPLPTPSASPAYPLKMSANHRYFVDQNNIPMIMIGDSPQSLGGNLTAAQQNTYFADRQAKGFNAAWVNILCASYTACASDGKTVGGVAPFTSGSDPASYDLSTPNTTYFALTDATINLASSYGINLFLDPIETGGWLVTLRNNGNTKAFNYGVYLGNRYKTFPNIVWFHGNDFDRYTDPTDNALVGQVMAG